MNQIQNPLRKRYSDEFLKSKCKHLLELMIGKNGIKTNTIRKELKFDDKLLKKIIHILHNNNILIKKKDLLDPRSRVYSLNLDEFTFEQLNQQIKNIQFNN